MNEIVDFVKELLLIKEEKNTIIGLTSFRKAPSILNKKIKKNKVNKEVRLSDLMRRA